MKIEYFRKATFWLSILLFLASLALPAYSANGFPTRTQVFGINVLYMGWLALTVFDLRWFANLFFAYAIWSAHKRKAPKTRRLCAFVLGISGVWTLAGPRGYTAVQDKYPRIGVTTVDGFQFEVGAYLWAASMVLASLYLFTPNNSFKPTPLRGVGKVS